MGGGAAKQRGTGMVTSGLNTSISEQNRQKDSSPKSTVYEEDRKKQMKDSYQKCTNCLR